MGKDPDKETDDKSNPFEELTKQFSDILGKVGANVSVTPFPFGPAEESTGQVPSDLAAPEDNLEALKRIKNFNFKPREIKEYLDRFVISQNEAKKVLSVAICDHYNHIRRVMGSESKQDQDYIKQNVLVLGPTGVGKTYLVKTIAKLIGVPFVKADATKFSETGYVGGDVEDLVRNLIKVADGDVELAQYGIIFIDEIDKITNVAGDNVRDVSGRGVQINLLKLMEETDVSVFSQMDMLSQVRTFMSMGGSKKQPEKINTKNILFIVSGAFDKLSDVVSKRIGKGQIGFGSADENRFDEYGLLKNAETIDFINYGFEPEFIGRLPVRVACQSLGENELEEILVSSEGSILNQYYEDFFGYGIQLSVDKEALSEVAKLAVKEKTGARGLLTILEGIFRELKFALPSTNLKSLKMTIDGVKSPSEFLEKVLAQADFSSDSDSDFARFIDAFESNYGVRFNILPEARAEISKISREENKSIITVCGRLFKDFGYGFHLISGQDTLEIEITLEAIQNPDAFLSQKIMEHFRGNSNEGVVTDSSPDHK